MDVKKGRDIYEKLLPTLLPHYPGQYIIINTDNSEYWVNADMTKALQEAKAKFPSIKFYIAKIGAPEGSVAQFS
jgi:hypothetical protein